MKKIILFAAATAVALSSCSKNEMYVNPTDAAKAVGFGTYVGSATKATVETAFEADDLFVIDAYYTGTADMNGASASYATFMQNQKVTTVDGSAWTYSPIKYWPNNNGDKVSFFAVTNATDASPITDFVDGLTADHEPSFEVAEANTDIMVASVLNQEETDSNVNFEFQHTMAQVKFTAKLEAALAANTDTDDKTEVKITSLKVDYGASNTAKGGTFTYNIAASATTVGSWSDGTGERNADIWDTDAAFGIGTVLDETKTPAIGEPIMIIPVENSKYTVTVIYTVTTTDNDNAANNSEVTNTCTFKIEPETMNTIYTYNLEIGLKSVKVSGSIANNWGASSETVEIVDSIVE